MGTNYTKTNVSSGFQQTSTLNQNFTDIENALSRSLSRFGDGSNQMEDHLDLNSFRIINLKAPSVASDAARLKDVQDSVSFTNAPSPDGQKGKTLVSDGDNLTYQMHAKVVASISEIQNNDQSGNNYIIVSGEGGPDTATAMYWLDPNESALQDVPVIVDDSAGNKFKLLGEFLAKFANMAELVGSKFVGSDVIYLAGYYSEGDGGGGFFYRNGSKSKSNHDGGSVIDITHTATPGTAAFYTDDGNTSNGVFERPTYTDIPPLAHWGVMLSEIGNNISAADLGDALAAAIVGGVPARIIASESDQTITAGTDTDTNQEALDLIPVNLRHNWTINFQNSATDDLVVPHFQSFVENRENNAIPHAASLAIIGDQATPSNVQINTIYFSGGSSTERITFDGVQLQGKNDVIDGTNGGSMEVRNGCQVVLQAVNFNNQDTKASRAVSVYGGNVIAKGPIDVGTDLYDVYVAVKDGGIFTDESDDAGNDTTGTTSSVPFINQNGQMYISRNLSITMSAGSPFYQLARSKRGPVYSFNGNIDDGNIQLEGSANLENKVPLSGCVGGGSNISVLNGSTNDRQRLRIVVPNNRILVLQWIKYYILNTGLRLEVDVGNNVFTASDAVGEERPETVLLDNIGNGSSSNANILVRVVNNSGSDTNLQVVSGWSMQFEIR